MLTFFVFGVFKNRGAVSRLPLVSASLGEVVTRVEMLPRHYLKL